MPLRDNFPNAEQAVANCKGRVSAIAGAPSILDVVRTNVELADKADSSIVCSRGSPNVNAEASCQPPRIYAPVIFRTTAAFNPDGSTHAAHSEALRQLVVAPLESLIRAAFVRATFRR